MICLNCQWCICEGQRKGLGLCWKDKPEERKPHKITLEINCKKGYQLGCMANVKANKKLQREE